MYGKYPSIGNPALRRKDAYHTSYYGDEKILEFSSQIVEKYLEWNNNVLILHFAINNI